MRGHVGQPTLFSFSIPSPKHPFPTLSFTKRIYHYKFVGIDYLLYHSVDTEVTIQ